MIDKSDENLVSICTTEDEVHEALITAALNDSNIEHVVRGFRDEAFDGLFEDRYGHSQILVLEDDVEKAKEAIKDIPNPKNMPDQL